MLKIQSEKTLHLNDRVISHSELTTLCLALLDVKDFLQEVRESAHVDAVLNAEALLQDLALLTAPETT